jgi:hypothetical protein
MANTNVTQLKITTGVVQLEYAGPEEFIRSELSTLLKSMDSSLASRLTCDVTILKGALQDSGSIQKELAEGIDQLKDDLDSKSEMGEMESLRLQMAMDRLSKLMQTLSNIMKKMEDTANSITQNLK